VRAGLDATFPIPFGAVLKKLGASDLSLHNKRIAANPIRIKTSFNSGNTVNGVEWHWQFAGAAK
jgi:hypothetical protein